MSPAGTNNSRVTFTRKNGFTLIEMLVVVVIIAITFSVFMTLNFSFGNPKDAIKKEGLRLQNLMQFGLEQAVIRSENYGLRVNENRYRFMKLDETTQKWNDLGDRILSSRQLPDNMSFELYLEDIEAELDEEDGDNDQPDVIIKPQVFLLSSEEVTPDFKILIRLSGFDDVYELHGSPAGKFELRDLSDEF